MDIQIAGLDIGTTGCKLTVFDEKGTYLGKAYRDYPVTRDENQQEIDPWAIRDSVLAVIREMTAQYPDIRGIGVTSFGETFVLTGEDGEPLMPAMLYTDPRGAQECQELKECLGERKIAEITGLNPHEMYSVAKIMWVKKNRPQLFARAKHIFLIEDFIVHWLTGVAQIDYSLATRTMAFDIRKLCWSGEILEAAGISERLLSRPVATGAAAGSILPAMADKTGLRTDTCIVSVSHDQVAAVVGSGVFESGLAVDGAGTVECITPVFRGIPQGDAMYQGSYCIVPYVIPGTYVSYAFSYTGGALIQWCVDTLAGKEKEIAGKQGQSVNEMLEQKEARKPTGLLVLPHFSGAATPYMDTGSKGAILGLTTAVTLPEIYRACMEGVVYEMQLNCRRLAEAGISFDMLYATGGGATSKVWMQMKADVLGMPITALDTKDAGTVGSAMLTGVAVGIFRNLEDAAAHMVEKKEVYQPREEWHRMYQEIYQKYQKVYEAVRPLV